jgi:uncharacterized membrane protein
MKVGNKMLAVFAGLILSSSAFAASSGISEVAKQVQSQFNAIMAMVSAGAYVIGIAFIIGGILKLKAYKDNPQSTALGVPMTMLAVGALLVYLQGIVQALGGTLFSNATSVGTGGSSAIF